MKSIIPATRKPIAQAYKVAKLYQDHRSSTTSQLQNLINIHSIPRALINKINNSHQNSFSTFNSNSYHYATHKHPRPLPSWPSHYRRRHAQNRRSIPRQTPRSPCPRQPHHDCQQTINHRHPSEETLDDWNPPFPQTAKLAQSPQPHQTYQSLYGVVLAGGADV